MLLPTTAVLAHVSSRHKRAPALNPALAAMRRPLFFTMKLAPMKIEEEMAKTRPTAWSETIPASSLLKYPELLLGVHMRHNHGVPTRV